MEIGVSFPQNGVGSDRIALRDFVQAAEGLGYDYLFSGDHVLGEDPQSFKGRQGPYTVDFIYHEPFVLFAYLASVTTRIRFHTGVLILPQRQTALVAKQAAELDFLSDGRLRLGVGVGWNQLEYQALNEEFGSRGDRMREQFDLMRQLWTHETVTFDGRWHQVNASGLNPLPVQRPIPLWIGGEAESVLRRTGEIADGWIVALPASVPATPEAVAGPWTKVRDYALAAGRDPSSIGLQAGVGPVPDATPEALCRRLDEWKHLGATSVTFGTRGLPSGLGVHLEAISRFKHAIQGWGD